LVGISAAAHALDALYGQLANAAVKAAGVAEDSSRATHVRDCLCRRFRVDNATSSRWTTEFAWLFGLRDAAVHAPFANLAVVPHPSGVAVMSPLMHDYSVETCRRAVDLLLDVLDYCTLNPRPRDAESVEWSTAYRPGVMALARSRIDQAERT
jgi:hypothetical protein